MQRAVLECSGGLFDPSFQKTSFRDEADLDEAR